MKLVLAVLLGLISLAGISQNIYNASDIPENLKENANSVIRKENIAIEIETPKKLTKHYELVMTILNKNGNRHFNPTVRYDNVTKIKSAEARVYDSEGKELKKIKKRDFTDISAVSGGTLYSDNRMLVFEYYPEDYPYTIAFKYEVETGNTAHVPPFIPMGIYNSSVQESYYAISYGPGVQIRQKLTDPNNQVDKTETPGSVNMSVSNLPALDWEYHSPRMDSRLPSAFFTLDKFYLQGVPGGGKDWAEFGKWMNTQLLQDTKDLPNGTKTMIKNLVGDASTIEEKARIVYDYVQKNTRYISVQVGIGGWKPMKASEVDKLGYGDCKALTNYTQALLEEVGVPSYYTVLFGDEQKQDIQPDFASLQGNHVILAVPNGEDDTIWLECTSQSTPFGFIANFTDDREVLLVTPEGGKIVHTTAYPYQQNSLKTKGKCVVFDNGSISVDVTVETQGTQYSTHYEIESLTKDEKDQYYKDYWDYIDNIALKSVSFENDKKDIKFTETVQFDARSYTSSAGDNLIFPVNVLNRISYIPKRYKDRKFPLYISRGFVDEDVVSIELPPGFAVTSLPDPINLETKFGRYISEILETAPGKYEYRRQFEIQEGEFPKEEYEDYRKFMKKVSRHDNQKIILTKL